PEGGPARALTDWGIRGCGVLKQDAPLLADLAAQDGLYSLTTRPSDGNRRTRVIGSILAVRDGNADPEGALDWMTDPSTRIVSLTITEGGYHLDPSTGRYDPTSRAAEDDARRETPSSAFGLIAEALRRRRDAGVEPFTVLSCDNLRENGETARGTVLGFAAARDRALADWIGENVAFPNCMVDRITPVPTEADRLWIAERHQLDDRCPVSCEPFTQWVLEDRFPAGRPPLEQVGALFVDDVRPYEDMKMRLLNASHQVLSYMGVLAGLTYFHEACGHPVFGALLPRYYEREAIPTLAPVPGVNLGEYCATLLERFTNTEMADTLARQCVDTSERVPKFVLPAARDNLRAGRPVGIAALAVASWARYLLGSDELGREIRVVDRRADELATAVRADPLELSVFLALDLFREVDRAPFRDAVVRANRSLAADGAEATAARCLGGT
ncbi:MAG TPA: mannitol dehydrogenase family protein, partial [Actinomycetaceae bacterium]|nr:mannitol dehydrogenase family protein [Actinomycetaceae bacterium]